MISLFWSLTPVTQSMVFYVLFLCCTCFWMKFSFWYLSLAYIIGHMNLFYMKASYVLIRKNILSLFCLLTDAFILSLKWIWALVPVYKIPNINSITDKGFCKGAKLLKFDNCLNISNDGKTFSKCYRIKQERTCPMSVILGFLLKGWVLLL